MRAISSRANVRFSPRRFINTIAALLGMSDRQVALKAGTTPQKLNYWQKHATSMRMFLGFLCALRRLSGLSWTKFGALLDDEFLDETKKDEKK